MISLIINNSEIMEIDIADTPFQRIKGLMFKKSINKALLIKPCNSIHTFFMKVAIDILYIDKNGKIIKIAKNMKPWRVGPLVFGCYSVVELPKNSIDKHNIKLNDIVCFRNTV